MAFLIIHFALYCALMSANNRSDEPPHIGKPKSHAGGTPAVASSLRHVMKTAGPIRGTQALLKLNQTDGFDCPSCAWPDPDDERAITEFCENGAKAIASEATTAQIDRQFFRKYSIEELREQSDYWHDQQGRLVEPMVLREGASHYEPIDWDDAFELIGSKLKSLDNPAEVASRFSLIL